MTAQLRWLLKRKGSTKRLPCIVCVLALRALSGKESY